MQALRPTLDETREDNSPCASLEALRLSLEPEHHRGLDELMGAFEGALRLRRWNELRLQAARRREEL